MISFPRGSIPIFALLLTFASFTKIQGGVLTSSIAFPSLAIFNSLAAVWTILPGTMIKLTEGLVSLKRLSNYLSGPEVQLDSMTPTTPTDGRDGSYIISKATFTYPSSTPITTEPTPPPTIRQGRFFLRDISLSIPIGRTTIVAGPVASGKSLLLLGLLGEADLVDGRVLFPQSSDGVEMVSRSIDEDDWLVSSATAFVPQVCWSKPLLSEWYVSRIALMLAVHH